MSLLLNDDNMFESLDKKESISIALREKEKKTAANK